MSSTEVSSFGIEVAAADAVATAAERVQASPPAPKWSNLHAPDARTASSEAVTVRAGVRELRLFLSNPNAIIGLVIPRT